MAMTEFVIATKIILFFGVKLFGAVRLIEPNYPDGIGGIMDNTFGDGEIFALGASDMKVADFTLDYDFAWANFGKPSGGVVAFVRAWEIIEEVTEGLDAGFIENSKSLGAYAFDIINAIG